LLFGGFFVISGYSYTPSQLLDFIEKF